MFFSGSRQKFAVLFLLALAVFSLFLLSSSLSTTRVSTEWRAFDLDDEQAGRGDPSALNDLLARLSVIPDSVLQALYMTIIIILPLTIIFALFSPEMRRAILHELRRAVSLAIWVAAIAYLIRLWQQNRRISSSTSSGGPLPAAPDWIREPSAMIAFGLTLFFMVLVSGIAWFLWRKFQPEPLELLAQEAQTTLVDLQMGRDFKNSIIECYANMCGVLYQERKLIRAQGMTPSEFAARLENFGIVGPQAQRLTRLFEKVRYGRHKPTDQDKAEAIACLETIVQAAQQ